MIYFTSDLHFGHDRDFIYKPRGFENVYDHDVEIIKNWNEIVKWDDEVYILGDLMLMDNKHGISCLNQLNGTKYFIRGNHDSASRVELYQENGIEYLGESATVKIKGYTLYLSHYPTLVDNFDTDKPLKRRIINIHGHVHNEKKFYVPNLPTAYNVNLEAHDNRPVQFEQIIRDIQKEINKEV